MRVIVAPNAFKGSLKAYDVAAAISRGVKTVFPQAETIELPIADGGDGTLDVVIGATDGEIIEIEVTGPLGQPVTAQYGLLTENGVKTAIIEMAAASGLRLMPPDQLNPMKTTTYGTGELIRAALDQGCRRVIIGVGGSATVDGGTGMAQALGAKLLDEQGAAIGYGGDGLSQLNRIDTSEMHPAITQTEFIVASDVENPLVGPQGAAHVFGPQKGATPEMVKQLDVYLQRYGEIIARDLGPERGVLERPSMGAAGGLAAGLVAFLGATIESGADVLLDLMGIDEHLASAQLVITGEGQIDAQTAYGKGPMVVARRAKQHGIPVIALAGGLADDADVVLSHGVDALVAIPDRPMTLETAIQNAPDLIEKATARALRLTRLSLD